MALIRKYIFNTLLQVRNALYPGNSRKLKRGGEIAGLPNMVRAKIFVDGKSRVVCSDYTRLRDLKVMIRGDGNLVHIEKDCCVTGFIDLVGAGNVVHIGAGTKINGAFLMAHGGRKILIGGHCLFSTQIDIRTTDSHKIFNDSLVRINPDADVVIGNYVWIGRGVSVLKNTAVGDGTVIGSMSVASGRLDTASVYAGIPARKIRSNITWEE